MLREATESDFDEILHVINDAAIAYKGIIPEDRWHEPYMTRQQLQTQIEEGVRFLCCTDDNEIVGVMGAQEKTDVILIRHAYVRTTERKKGIGSMLIYNLLKDVRKSTLVGTWQAAHWAIRFYEQHGFTLVPEKEKNSLLTKYWNIPDRQVETSVVLIREQNL